MAFTPIFDCLKVVLNWNTSQVRWSNTLYFEINEPDQADVDTLGAYLEGTLFNGLLSALTSATELESVLMYDMSSENAPVYSYTLQTPVVGQDNAPSAAINAAAVVTFYTIQRGRSGRGRNYISGISETQTGTNSYNPLTMTDIENAYNTILTGGMPLGYQWIVVSRQLNGVPHSVGQRYPVTRVAVRNALLGSQRKRIRKV